MNWAGDNDRISIAAFLDWHKFSPNIRQIADQAPTGSAEMLGRSLGSLAHPIGL
jgi:hypothetical protein